MAAPLPFGLADVCLRVDWVAFALTAGFLVGLANFDFDFAIASSPSYLRAKIPTPVKQDTPNS